MTTIVKARNGHWRAQIRRKGKYASRTFRLRGQAEVWARETETPIDKGNGPLPASTGKIRTIAHLIDLHIADLQEVGKPLRRSKRAVLEALRRDLGSMSFKNLDRSTQSISATFPPTNSIYPSLSMANHHGPLAPAPHLCPKHSLFLGKLLSGQPPRSLLLAFALLLRVPTRSL